MEGATPDKRSYMNGDLARFLSSGEWEEGHCSRWVSRLFLVPKPGVNKWRLIIDLRPLHQYEERGVKLELRDPHSAASFGSARRLHALYMDMRDGFYAVGIGPEDRDYCIVDYRDKLYRLAGLPMGWSLSPCYLCSFTAAFNRHMRRPTFSDPSRNASVQTRDETTPDTATSRRHFRGCRMLIYMDDFMFFASSRAHAYAVRYRITSLLGKLGLDIPIKASGSRCNGWSTSA
eukprot:jgi/Tetstr1/436389/TSEL_025221.t1